MFFSFIKSIIIIIVIGREEMEKNPTSNYYYINIIVYIYIDKFF